jgi:nicotinate phosphoribosyltransferase
LALEDEPCVGTPLLVPVMREGRRIRPQEPLSEMRTRLEQQLACLPPRLKNLSRQESYRVEISSGLRALTQQLDARSAA